LRGGGCNQNTVRRHGSGQGDVEACDVSEPALISRASGGNDAAFAELVARYGRRTFFYIKRLMRGSSDAHDAYQETLLAAWRSLAQYQTPRPFETWLRRIALNKCRDHARRTKTRAFVRIAQDCELLDCADPAGGPLAAIETHERFTRVAQQFATLPAHLKIPLELTALQGLSCEQAGRVLGITARAVESKLYRARAQLMSSDDLGRSMTRPSTLQNAPKDSRIYARDMRQT
jgi:RNA polymerase sigma factor (sigma-70 family)